MRILKYPILMIAQPFEVDLSPNAKIVKVGMDAQGVAVFWATEPSIKEAAIQRQFLVVGTGAEVPPQFGTYHGTWINGRFVWHLMEKSQ